MRKRLISGLLTVLVVGVLLYLAAGYVVYTTVGNVQHNCDQHRTNRPDHFTNISLWPELDLSAYFMPTYEAVRFPSRNPAWQLSGWYVERDPVAPVVIFVDGLNGCKYAQAVLVPGGMLWRNGFNVLFLDLHDTGDSTIDDGYATIGMDEALDVAGAWDWLITAKGFTPERIGLSANSLGTAATLYAFVDEPRMAALFLQSPIANLPQVIREELDRLGYPAWLAPGGIIMARLLTGINIVERSPLTEIAQVGQRPVFVVHSTADTRVRVDHSQQLETAATQAGANVTFWYVDDATHVRTPAFYPVEYEQHLVTFFRDALANQ